jgi:hypothetical protein
MDEFCAGQEWKYSTRPNEQNSTLVILKVEEYEGVGEVVHIALDGLSIRNIDNPEAPHSDISHMPFVADTVRECITELVGYTEIPDFSEGYECWKEAYEDGDAGFFTITVAESVEFMEETLSNGEEVKDS